MYIYIYIHMSCMCIYIYIQIYDIHVYIYIYMYLAATCEGGVETCAGRHRIPNVFMRAHVIIMMIL